MTTNRRPAGASAALLAVSRVFDAALRPTGPDAVHCALVGEAQRLFGTTAAVLVDLRAGQGTGAVVATTEAAASGQAAVVALRDAPGLSRAADPASARPTVLAADELAAVAALLGIVPDTRAALVLPMRAREAVADLLVLLDSDEHAFSDLDLDLAGGFADAAAACLAQLRETEEHAARIAQLSALTRAAKTLNESLQLDEVLARMCEEARGILDADAAELYQAQPGSPLVMQAAAGLAEGALGYELAPGQGLAGQVAQADRPMFTNDYRRLLRPAPDSPFAELRSCLAVPMHWSGALRGVLSVGYRRSRGVGEEELQVLQSFAELASVACANASAAAGLQRAARTDALTGCLNHAALQEGLRREVERAERTGSPLCVVLVDLDEFKEVNERHGHLVGDEVLRRVGHALRSAVRPYDLVARYGGDEFALLAAETDERGACEIGGRVLERIGVALQELGDATLATSATAGVSQWEPGEPPAGLVERADRALLWGKQQGTRGAAIPASSVPDAFRRGRFRRGVRWPAPEPSEAEPPSVARLAETARLQKRTRQLVLANALGSRLAAMTDVQAILEAAVEELHGAFGYFLCAVVRVRSDDFVERAAGRGDPFVGLGQEGWSQPRQAGLIGRCLRERRVVLSNDVAADEDYRATLKTESVRSELVAPLWVGDTLWGALNIEEAEAGAFDEDDARLVQSVADQIGSALRSALLYERLDRAYLGTAEALAAALEAKDSYTAQHAQSIVAWADAVGRGLGMDEEALRDLRYGAVFHDIGKIAVPEVILNKRGALDDAEWEVVKRHTLTGEQILAPVDFLAGARPLVRHEHERWDGTGYPDGLAGDQIPLGARVILVCDAYHAMTSDRPYRAAMDDERAREELRREAGTQFDPVVVDAFLATVKASAPDPRA